MNIKTFGRKILDYLTLGILAELPLTHRGKTEYIAALKKLSGTGEQRFLFDHFYMNLGVLDGKVNSMIQFNSVMVALYAAVLAYSLSFGGNIKYVLLVGIGMMTFAALNFLGVEKVHWSTPSDISDVDTHARRLLDIRDRRTVRYRVGWIFSFYSLLILVCSMGYIAVVSKNI
jgi:hypothetical protein